ncbi:hypothetical protein [Yaniella flava]|uniref:hypothetical protein n=1 Tax=Yaniella flava TaxID=287930 RepID=UPI0031CDC4C8
MNEPTTGLHIANVARLVNLLNDMVDDGTSVIVIEHDLDIAASDWVIDIGPGAGSAGGTVVFEGTPAELVEAETPTGQHLARAVQY